MLNNQQIKISAIVSVSYSTVSGCIFGGIKGCLFSLGISVMDEYLIHHNYTSKHHLSLTSFWYMSTVAPLSKLSQTYSNSGNMPISIGLYIIAASYSYLTDDFLDFSLKLSTSAESFCLINQFFDKDNIFSFDEAKYIYNLALENTSRARQRVKEDVNKIYNNQFLNLFTKQYVLSFTNIIGNQIFLKYFAMYDKNLLLPNVIENFDRSKVLWTAGKIVFCISTKKVVDNLLKKYLDSLFNKQFENLFIKSSELIFENSNGRKILVHPRGKELNDNLMHDLWKLNYRGTSTIIDSLDEITTSLFSLYTVINQVPILFALYSSTVIVKHFFCKQIISRNNQIINDLTIIQNQETDIRSDIRDNIEQINIRDGGKYMIFRATVLANKKNLLETEKKQLLMLYSSIGTIFENINNFFNVLDIIKKFDQVDLGSIIFLSAQARTIDKFYSSNLNFYIENTEIFVSMERLKVIFSLINTADNNHAHKLYNQNKVITFRNYTLNLDGKQLVHINNFSFLLGKKYAITGNSGSGKTSVLVDLKAGVYGSISSKGTISVPEINGRNEKIVFFNQKLYLPKSASLLETIYFPNLLANLSEKEKSDLKNKIISLLKEISIDELSNDPSKDKGLVSKLESKSFKLSGGQEKKIAIIQAILSQEAIYILDETFTGLDNKSVATVQSMLNKYLPNSTILVVDHHAIDNNYNGFYDLEVNFADGEIIEKEIAPKTFNLTLAKEIYSLEVEIGVSGKDLMLCGIVAQIDN